MLTYWFENQYAVAKQIKNFYKKLFKNETTADLRYNKSGTP